ncbi:hypothetical protein V8F20_000133 [Naviculisporaceae sp. PSN 640]
MASWNALPDELRLMIFKELANSHTRDYDFEGKRLLRAGYAAVCWQWCDFFEKHNFRSLIIDQDRIKDLQMITSRGSRRAFVRFLWLRVRLEEYDCDVCHEEEDVDTVRRNNITFTKAVIDLMAVLATWPRPQDLEHGLTLELSAFSPSDSKHAFKYFRLEQSYPYLNFRELDPKLTAYKTHLKANRSLHDPAHGWTKGHQEPPDQGSKLRIQGSLRFLPELVEPSLRTRWEYLRVQAVVWLMVRRQFHRKIPTELLADLLHRVCPSLEGFHHGSWLDMTDNSRERNPDSYMLQRPLIMRHISLFADHNHILHPRYSNRSTYRADRRWTLNNSLSRTLCVNTRDLETFAFTTAIDARDFFSLFAPQAPPQADLPTWWRLRSLVITSNLLTKKAKHWEIENLLVAAGRAAARMPALLYMEIWNGGKGHHSAFGYYLEEKPTTSPNHERSQRVNRHPKILWRSTWVWGPNPRENIRRVAHAWEEALGLGFGAIEVLHCKYPASKAEPIQTRWPAIDNLRLKELVCDRISRYQLSWEEQEAQARLRKDTASSRG